jgi:hypothetical protein
MPKDWAAYYEENKERIKARRRERYAANAEDERAYQREAYARDPESYNARKRAAYHARKHKKIEQGE